MDGCERQDLVDGARAETLERCARLVAKYPHLPSSITYELAREIWKEWWLYHAEHFPVT